MSDTSAQVISGLEGVLACESAICHIDGQKGVLLYRGYPIQQVADRLSFEETAHLLWEGEVPVPQELQAFRETLSALRDVDPEVIEVARLLPRSANPMTALRTLVSAEAAVQEARETVREPRQDAYQLTAKMATLVAYLKRLWAGEPLVPPNPELAHAPNFLYMLNGQVPTGQAARTLDMALVLYAEHEMNASTFTCRVTVSTLSDTYSAVSAGLAALKGPLHGGAINDVMDMLQTVGTPENARAWVQEQFAAKRKIPGFGHRVYRTEDPRASHLRGMALRLAQESEERRWMDIAIAIEEAVKEVKPLNANVDYFSAPVLAMLGIPIPFFTCFIAVARVAGWSADIIEQFRNNRLLRPRALYTGHPERRLAGA